MNRLTIAFAVCASILLTSCRTSAPPSVVGRWEMDVGASTWFEDQGNVPTSEDSPVGAYVQFMPDGVMSGSVVFRDVTDRLDGSYLFDSRSITCSVVTSNSFGARTGKETTSTLRCDVKGDTMTMRNKHGIFVYRRND